MSHPPESRDKVRFADFELDLQTAELRINGQQRVLQGQSFLILTSLLASPGKVVSRDELKKRLWPEDTFVDFDHSLNKAVARLREVLDDSADEPKVIETVPRRGYRLMVEVFEDAAVDAPDIAENELQGRQGRSGPTPGAKIRQIFFYGVSTLLVVAAVGLMWRGWVRLTTGVSRTNVQIQSLAVLPIDNLSGDPVQEAFADAITDQLITDLGRYGRLRVISRTSVMQYKHARKLLPQIAQELGVDAVVEGAVVRSEDEVRINVQLIHALSDAHLWAESYKGNIRDVLRLQERVASDIAEKILAKLDPGQRGVPGTNSTIAPAAFDDYLAGYSQGATMDGLQNSIRFFDSAIQKQPDFAEAYAQRASAYMELGHMLALPPEKSFTHAKADAVKALELDQNLSLAHSVLGEIHLLYDWDFAAAEREAREAIELNPNKGQIHALYGELLIATGRYDEAMEQMRFKENLDPIGIQRNASRSALLYFGRHFEECMAHSQSVLNVAPNSFTAHLWNGLCLEQKRRFPEALTQIRKAVELSNDEQWVGFIAHDLAVSGHRGEAKKILHELQAKAAHTYVSSWWFAMIYSGLGEKEQAFRWLEKAYQEREHDLVFSNCWPMFDNLRGDPRWRDLVMRIGLRG